MKYFLIVFLVSFWLPVSAQKSICLEKNRMTFSAKNRVGIDPVADLDIVLDYKNIFYNFNLKEIKWKSSDTLLRTLISIARKIRITISNGTEWNDFLLSLCRLTEEGLVGKNLILETKYMNNE